MKKYELVFHLTDIVEMQNALMRTTTREAARIKLDPKKLDIDAFKNARMMLKHRLNISETLDSWLDQCIVNKKQHTIVFDFTNQRTLVWDLFTVMTIYNAYLSGSIRYRSRSPKMCPCKYDAIKATINKSEICIALERKLFNLKTLFKEELEDVK